MNWGREKPWRVGSCFCRERKSENTHRGTEQEICSPKPLIGRKDRVSTPPGFHKQWSAESEVLKFSAWQCPGEEVGQIPRSRPHSLRCLCPHRQKQFPCLESIWWRPYGFPTSKAPRTPWRAAMFAGVGTETPENGETSASCVL